MLHHECCLRGRIVRRFFVSRFHPSQAVAEHTNRQRRRSWRRDEMDRGRRAEDRYRDYHEDRGRPDARDRRPDRGQREYRDHHGDGWARGPRSGTDDWRSGAPRPSGGCQFETRYDAQAFQHQPRSEAMTVHNSSARRDEPPRRQDEPSLRRDEPLGHLSNVTIVVSGTSGR